ncbi:MAG: N-acetylmuramoyl-L-alanine amidase [Candidatus Eremiobacteraeota bacterium]|nr:N-acetylmuramoyl-L-alanine amidase [Candidatus Eremiobacteraeota bacterium]
MMPNALLTYPYEKLKDWKASFPAGRIDKIYLHWSAGDYRDVFEAYHYCVAIDDDGDIVVANTHDLRENMRNVSLDPEAPYAAHTRGRNSFAAGISVMSMKDAQPHDFGAYPLTEALVDVLCIVAARLAAFYKIPIEPHTILTHAEAAVVDGYFGSGEEERWDIARLAPSAEPLLPQSAAQVGDELRRRIRACL